MCRTLLTLSATNILLATCCLVLWGVLAVSLMLACRLVMPDWTQGSFLNRFNLVESDRVIMNNAKLQSFCETLLELKPDWSF